MFGKNIACTHCGYTGKSKTLVRGNAGTEILLWFFFLVPGIIYSIWRSTGAYKACPLCKSADIVPIDSPRGKEIAAKKK